MSLPNDNPIVWNAMRPVDDHDGYAAKTSTASVIASGLPPSSGITRISPSYATASRVPSGDQVIRSVRRGYTRRAPEPSAAPTYTPSGTLSTTKASLEPSGDRAGKSVSRMGRFNDVGVPPVGFTVASSQTLLSRKKTIRRPSGSGG